MKTLSLILISLFFTSCIIDKTVQITIKDSSGVTVDSNIKGSDLEDIDPSIEVPLLP